VQTFPTGAFRSAVEAVLGKPTQDRRGLWNTRAVTYELVPDRIDLGFLFDRHSGILKQTEAAFVTSTEPQIMLDALDGMLNGGAREDVKQGLLQVQQGKKSYHTFSQDAVKGQIVLQDCGFIYISIWERGLHDYNVRSSRKCY